MDSELTKRDLRRLRDQYVLADINVVTELDGIREESSMLLMILIEPNNAMTSVPLTYFDCYKYAMFEDDVLAMPFADFLFSKRKITNTLEKSISDALEVQMANVKQQLNTRGVKVSDIEISIVDEDFFYEGIETVSDLMYTFQADELLTRDVTTSLLGFPSPTQVTAQTYILASLGVSTGSAYMSIRGAGSLARIANSVEILDSMGVFCASSTQLNKFRSNKTEAVSAIRSLLGDLKVSEAAIGTDAFFIAVESDNDNGIAIYSLVGASKDTLYFEHSELVPFIHMKTDTPVYLAANNNSLGMNEVIDTLSSFKFSEEPEICLDSTIRIPLYHSSIVFYTFVSNAAFDTMQQTFAINGYDDKILPDKIIH